MWDLQTSLRSMDAGIWSLPREVELGNQEEPSRERHSYQFAASRRTSFVRHPSSCSSLVPSSSVPLKNGLKCQDLMIDELVEGMTGKLLVCERSSVPSSTVPLKNGLKRQDLVIDELVESMAGKLLVCERRSNMHVNELPRAA
mmetsp:Transcript_12865/g.32414  ORF Transcript_12865/g.32414 Transcript_12865/m.32414 type:complete len:143 (+) Transcript_12865:1-429(+)